MILLLLSLVLTAAEAAPLPFGSRSMLADGRFTRGEAWALLPLTVMVAAGPYAEDVRKCLPHNYFHASLGMLALSLLVFWLSLAGGHSAAVGEVALAE